jgi:hypothetical protein
VFDPWHSMVMKDLYYLCCAKASWLTYYFLISMSQLHLLSSFPCFLEMEFLLNWADLLEDHNRYIVLFLAALDTDCIICMTLPLPVIELKELVKWLCICIALLGLNVVKSPIVPSARLTVVVAFKSFGHSSFLVNLQVSSLFIFL